MKKPSTSTGAKQRQLQSTQDAKDNKSQAKEARPGARSEGKDGKDGKDGKEDKAFQAGTQEYTQRHPAQHLAKPGIEASLEEPPQFRAAEYLGSRKLHGFATLITGGDSGIGRAVAVLFAREGADVAIVYLEEHEDAQETARLVQAEGRDCLLIPGNVKDAKFCEQAVLRTVQQFGKLDVLVNNAAFQLHGDGIEDISDERLDETFDTNIKGYFRMARAAVPHLKQGGSIINTGSVTGLEGSGHLLDYASTKGAIHAFTKSLAQNLLPKGIRVNAVAPGPVWTPLNPADSPADKVARFGAQTDLKRAAQPEELSPAYVFLAAPCCASYITGLVLPITGSIGAI